MPKRTDIHSILIIGAGPIIIGQACEFDYSGSQACKALREEGFRVILVNSNPATIMTDPDMADVTYIEPLTPEAVEKIIAKERPDALLPTLGGQTALNLALNLAKSGVLAKYNVELIGAKADAIERGEDRQKFRQIMLEIGLDIPKSKVVKSIEEARACVGEVGGNFPIIIRPSFTLGGTGGGIAYNREEYERMVAFGLDCSPVHEVLVEECLLGWKEFEMEVMRDHKDQCVIICSIENFDPMGVHTGDSITLAPALTLTDKEYQLMRDASFAVIRAIGVETGGSNIQFAVNPANGRLIVIEMNPRVSRSSALASKATGFPIAKIAAKLAIGYALDELRNDITRVTPASFEPAIDYVVTKVPRFAFEKFNGTDRTLTSSMKAVGEVMAIGRTFQESFQKALRSLEIGAWGFGGGGKFGGSEVTDADAIRAALVTPTAERVFYIRYAFQAGLDVAEIHALSAIDPWFLHQLKGIYEIETRLAAAGFDGLDADLLRTAKAAGFTDRQLAHLTRAGAPQVREKRLAAGVRTVYRLVDTCAAEFEAKTPYYYSSHGDENEIMPSAPAGETSTTAAALGTAPQEASAGGDRERGSLTRLPGTRVSDPLAGNAGLRPAPTEANFAHKGWHSRHYLPHRDDPGLIQSITFRLADSVPASVLQAWKEELALQEAPGTPPGTRVSDPPAENAAGDISGNIAGNAGLRPACRERGSPTRLAENAPSLSTSDLRVAELQRRLAKYEDAGHGACHLRDPRIAEIVQNAFLHYDGKHYRLLEWVVMPNHIHVLIKTLEGTPLSEIVRAWKTYTAREANALLGTEGKFWADDYFDRYIRDTAHFADARNYININPVTAGLVKTAKEWPFGSAALRESETRAPGSGSETRVPGPAPAASPSPAPRKKIMILGGGPNRIGQGIEFDYCCVHASFALRDAGYETVMVNSNPETVSTDYDTSDRLYFEPLTLEDVLEIYQQEQCAGAIVQFGGQTPLNLATALEAAGVKIIGTSPASIELAEDRQLFKDILLQLDIKQPENRIALSPEQAYAMAGEIGFPILLRPSFVLGGRGMFITYSMDELKSVVREAFDVAPGKPVLLDKFLEDAIELDVDAISDGETTIIGGMLEHIEYAGVHSGDAAMVLPPHTLPDEIISEVRRITHALAKKLRVIGLMNIQFAIKDGAVYMLEVNPRASRTVPFVSKAIGVPLAKLAARCMVGEKLPALGLTAEIIAPYYAVKESVFPFNRFPGAPVALSPEMRSTGEVMGLDADFGIAYAKSQMAAQPPLPAAGNVFFSVKDRDKPAAIEIARELTDLGFQIYSTAGTAKALEEAGLPVHHLHKITGGGRPNVLDMLKNGQMQMIINTPTGMMPRRDENMMRSEAVLRQVCMISTIMGAKAAVHGIRALRGKELTVTSLQEYGERLKAART